MQPLLLSRFVIVVFVFCLQWARAVPLIGPSGNAYEFVRAETISWDDASTLANEAVFEDVNGHLATIFDQAENDFVLSLLTGVGGSVWLGGSDAAVEGEWRWVTGEQFWQGIWQGEAGPDVPFANWIAGVEPNNHLEGEDYLTMLGPDVFGWGNAAPGLWNDMSPSTMNRLERSDFYIHGYVVEYDVAPIPEIPPHWLMGMGVVCLPIVRRIVFGRGHF